MHRILFIPLLVLLACAGCATPDKLTKRDVRDISNISVAIDATVTTDAPGFTDSIDLAMSKSLADKLLELTQSTLKENGFTPLDHHISTGMAAPKEKFYVIADASDRKRDIDQLARRAGPYFSDRLDRQQLDALYKSIDDKDDIPRLGAMGFGGDTTLVAMVQGRLIGTGKSIGAYFANAAIIVSFVASGGGSFGGSPELMDTDNTYSVRLRLYSTNDGNILWQHDIKAHGVEELLHETAKSLKERIPGKR
ncbi:MAG: hypothetical protein PVJ39_05180 [Gammaproteobacteria bacterium]|jgi:hypothetical protein